MNIEINTKSVELSDKEIIEPFYKREQSLSCEHTFANNLLWSPYYSVTYAILCDCLVFFAKRGEEISVSFPLGKGNIEEAVKTLREYFANHSKPFAMHLVTAEQFDILEKLFPNQFSIEYQRDSADYIYESEKLITLSGKKLHGKRNHINQFKEEHSDWQYEDITSENLDECMEMAKEWRKINCEADDDEKQTEYCVTIKALEMLEELHLTGGLLRAEGKVIAFTIGEAISDKAFVVHVEKAFADIRGAYPMMNQLFAQSHAAGYQYINREEDVGSEGLRQAKLSYRPTFLLEKGIVKAEDETTA